MTDTVSRTENLDLAGIRVFMMSESRRYYRLLRSDLVEHGDYSSLPAQHREPADDVAEESLLLGRSSLGHPVWRELVSAAINAGRHIYSRYCPPDVGAIYESFASEAAHAKVQIQVAK